MSRASSVQGTNIVELGSASRLLLSDPVREWRPGVIATLNDLVRLRTGWNGYQATAVSFENANFALRMLEVACGVQAPAPQLVPGVDGDLQIEWHTKTGDIELHVIAPNRVHAWRLTPETAPDGEELDLTNDFTRVAVWVKKLAEGNSAVAAAAA